jgi:uncharacterized C2H2 Zn-finger protein
MHKCKRCNKIYKYKSDYDRHVNRKNPCKRSVVSTVFKCSECLNTYATKGSLKRHQNGYCTAKQEDSDDNQSDQEEIDEQLIDSEDDSEFMCKHCNKTFTRKFNLERHIASRCTVKKTAEAQKANEYAKIKKDIEYVISRFNDDIDLLYDLQTKLNAYKLNL